LARLDAIGNSKFDREVAEQIFDQCSQKDLGDVTVSNFAKMYADGVVLSRHKIEKLKIDIEELKKKMHFYRMKTDEVREKDKTLSKGSLMVTLIEKCWSSASSP
jgi:hypothetical protein